MQTGEDGVKRGCARASRTAAWAALRGRQCHAASVPGGRQCQALRLCPAAHAAPVQH